MSSAPDARIEDAIGRRAAEWFVRHRQNDLTVAEQRDYLEWLRASPRHVEAYLNIIALSENMSEAIAGLDIDLEALLQRVATSPTEPEGALFTSLATVPSETPAHRKTSWLALAAAVVIAVGVGGYWIAGGQSATTIAVPAERQKMLRLEDGSLAHLDSNTRLTVHYSNAQRVIELSEGRVLFHVTHDARRPFIVRAGSTEVVAVGTSFEVFRRAQTMRVTVVEGRIEIIGHTADDSDTRVPATPLRLQAGEQVSMADRSTAARPIAVDAQAATAWAHTEVSFRDARLEDVASQFNRYTGVQITIADPSLRDYRISGVFQAYDLESFVAYLGHFQGVALERQGDDIRVERRPP